MLNLPEFAHEFKTAYAADPVPLAIMRSQDGYAWLICVNCRENWELGTLSEHFSEATIGCRMLDALHHVATCH